MADVESKTKNQKWFYSDIVKDHFLNPRNIVKDDSEIEKMVPDGVGQVGSPACGDVMKLWFKVDQKTQKITGVKWQTFGCASAIASTSMLSVMLTENGGLTLAEAEKIKPNDIIERLGGLPAVKVHCSVLGDQALRAAIKDYREKVIKE